MLECEVWKANPRWERLWALRKQPEGAGMRSSKTRSARGRSLDGCTKCHCLVMHKAGGCHCRFSPHAPAATAAGSAGDSLCTTVITASTASPTWVIHSPQPLPNGFSLSSRYPSTLLPGWPAHPDHYFGSFWPDGLVCPGYLQSRLWWEKHTQRWCWNHSGAPRAMWLRSRAEISPRLCVNLRVTPPLTAS